MLQVNNLKKSFGTQEVLKQVNFQLNMGEIVSIEGGSGGGKTTFLRCVCGLETFEQGEILLNGTPLTRENRTQIGLVFQDYQLFPHFNVLENVVRAPKYFKMGTKVQLEQAGRLLLEQLGVAEKIAAYPYQLSGGQKQRVAIARACMLKPKVLCLDEPTSALDQKSTEEIAKLIFSLQQKDRSVLVVSHDKEFVRSITDNNYEMVGGCLNRVNRLSMVDKKAVNY